jgi:hypothetical protein
VSLAKEKVTKKFKFFESGKKFKFIENNLSPFYVLMALIDYSKHEIAIYEYVYKAKTHK